jgi:hypothetical protein
MTAKSVMLSVLPPPEFRMSPDVPNAAAKVMKMAAILNLKYNPIATTISKAIKAIMFTEVSGKAGGEKTNISVLVKKNAAPRLIAVCASLEDRR